MHAPPVTTVPPCTQNVKSSPPSTTYAEHVPSFGLPIVQGASIALQVASWQLPRLQRLAGSGQLAVVVQGYSQTLPMVGSLAQVRGALQAVAGQDTNSVGSMDVSEQPALPPELLPPEEPPLDEPPVLPPFVAQVPPLGTQTRGEVVALGSDSFTHTVPEGQVPWQAGAQKTWLPEVTQ